MSDELRRIHSDKLGVDIVRGSGDGVVTVPDWVTYIAVDSDGSWFGYSARPSKLPVAGVWANSNPGDRNVLLGNIPYSGDWQDSLVEIGPGPVGAFWRTLPANAKWIARDEDDSWYFFRKRPKLAAGVWLPAKGDFSSSLTWPVPARYNTHWYLSRAKRPE